MIVKSRRLQWTGKIARMREVKNAYRIFMWKHLGKWKLGIPRRRWKDNIKMNFKEVGCELEVKRTGSESSGGLWY
jgi:hypothetical protein